ncbi:MAG: hypothetical protein ACTHJ8_11465, partial [Mucilaginibacter sp.]
MKRILKSNFFGLGLLLGLSFLLIYITDKYILSVDFFNRGSDIFSVIPEQVYHAVQKWIYFSQVIYTLVKVSLIALIIYTALYLSDESISFSRVLNIVIYCELIFLVPAALKIPWFLYKHPHGTLLDWHRTYILSALSFFNDVPADWYYPLQTLNVFEVAYWFLLAYGIYKATKLTFDNALKIIILSYVPALLIWVAMVSFCALV